MTKEMILEKLRSGEIDVETASAMLEALNADKASGALGYGVSRKGVFTISGVPGLGRQGFWSYAQSLAVLYSDETIKTVRKKLADDVVSFHPAETDGEEKLPAVVVRLSRGRGDDKIVVASGKSAENFNAAATKGKYPTTVAGVKAFHADNDKASAAA